MKKILPNTTINLICFDIISSMRITVKCKLNPTQEQVEILDETLSRCLGALNYVSKIAWEEKCFNRVVLHHFTYYKIKSKFELHSQICCAIINKVSFSYKTERKRMHIFKKAVLPLNINRTVRLKGTEIASISTISGRQKIALALGNYQKQMLAKAIKFCDSELIKRGKKFYLNIVIEIPDEPLKETENVIGVDMGIRNLATCSTGDNFSGEQVQAVRNRYHTLRQALQSKGTKSAKRHLKKLSGREKRFQEDVNHKISKQIVELAIKSNSAIALENLKNIRNTTKHRKDQRRSFHSWAFYQLRQFITYKAQMAGIPVFLVNPAYTSKTCSSCGSIGIRRGEHFHCPHCSFQADADFNASINISRAVVNQPIVATLTG